MPQAAPAPQPIPQAQSGNGWQNRGGGAWANGGGWRGRSEGGNGLPQVQPGWQGGQRSIPIPQAEAPRQQWSNRGGNWSRDNDRREERNRSGWGDNGRGRNDSYVDPNRNRAYSDPYRNRSYTEAWRGNRNGWNDNDRWRGDNSRWGYSHDNRRWNNDWRRDNRYDWYGYRSGHRSVFSLGYYYAPYRNYDYRRIGIGFRLDSLFFSSRYWIDDPWRYRLPEAYGSYRWIRYYDDVLLVDTYSGEVVDVIRDFFW